MFPGPETNSYLSLQVFVCYPVKNVKRAHKSYMYCCWDWNWLCAACPLLCTPVILNSWTEVQEETWLQELWLPNKENTEARWLRWGPVTNVYFLVQPLYQNMIGKCCSLPCFPLLWGVPFKNIVQYCISSGSHIVQLPSLPLLISSGLSTIKILAYALIPRWLFKGTVNSQVCAIIPDWQLLLPNSNKGLALLYSWDCLG